MGAFEGAGGERADEGLARRVLAERERFDVVLRDGTRWSCHLREYGERELLVETETGRYLLPWRSILYVVLEEQATGQEVLMAAVEEVPALQEFLGESPTEAVATEPT